MLNALAKNCAVILVAAGIVRVFDPVFGIGPFAGAGASSAEQSRDGEEFFAKYGCAECHGKKGARPLLQDYPKLNGQNAEYLLNQLRDIKSGSRNNQASATMQPYLLAIPDDELQAIAQYLSQQ